MKENKDIIKAALITAMNEYDTVFNLYTPEQLNLIFNRIIDSLLLDFTIIDTIIIENPEETQEQYAAYVKVKSSNGTIYKAGIGHNTDYMYVNVEEVII